MEHEIKEEQLEPTQPATVATLVAKIKKLATVRKLIVLAILLVAVVFFVIMLKTSPKIEHTALPTQTSYGSVYFLPSELDASISKPQTVDIYANSDGKSIAGVLIAIKYNPLLIKDVTLSQMKDPQSAFSTSLNETRPSYDPATGTAMLILTLPTNISQYAVNGKVAQLTYTPQKPTAPIISTPITLVENTSFLIRNGVAHTQLNRKSFTVVYKHVIIPTVAPIVK